MTAPAAFRDRMSPRFMNASRSLIVLLCMLASATHAQSIRNRTRPSWDTGTQVSESQASALTLTLTQAATRQVQTWVRAGGAIDRNKRTLVAQMPAASAALIKAGQRVRAFPPEAKSSIYRAWVTRVVQQGPQTRVEVTLPADGRAGSTYYVMEILVELGDFLSIPNEAIIEEGDRHVVY